MRLPPLPSLPAGVQQLPLWPPLLATRGPGSKSEAHAHHAMHLVLALDGALKVEKPGAGWSDAAGVLTAPDAEHAIDARGVEVVLVFFDPESDLGAALAQVLTGPVRAVSEPERAKLARDADPPAIMRAEGADWTRRVVEVLKAPSIPEKRSVHPRVKKALRLLRASNREDGASLEALANAVGLSPSSSRAIWWRSSPSSSRWYA